HPATASLEAQRSRCEMPPATRQEWTVPRRLTCWTWQEERASEGELGAVRPRQPSVAAESRGAVALSRFEARRLAPISMRSTMTSSAAARRSSARPPLRFPTNGEEPETAPTIGKERTPVAPATLFPIRHPGYKRLCR